MKNTIIGVFASRNDAEKVINDIHNTLSISHDDISYVYKNDEGEVKEVETSDISAPTIKEGAGKGAETGAVLGALAGLATVVGVIPVIGPLFLAGPIITALGISGALGVTAAGAATGATVGGLVGALVGMGATHERAQDYEDMVAAGNILLVVNSEKVTEIQNIMTEQGALSIDSYEVQV